MDHLSSISTIDINCDRDATRVQGVRRQYSGNEHTVIKGIGLVNCLYYNPEIDRFWVLDYRVFDPDRDGQSKLEHVSEMLDLLVHRGIEFHFCLMDSWYATDAFNDTADQRAKDFLLSVEEKSAGR